MGLLIHNNDNVPRTNSRLLIPLPVQRYLLPILHSPVHMNLDDLLIFDDLLPLTVLAAVRRVNSLPLTTAVVANGLDLLDHPGAELLHAEDHALAFTGGAFFWGFSTF